MNDIHNAIKEWLEANKANMVEDVIKSLEIPSESYDREGVALSLNQLLGVAGKLGFKTDVRANGEVGVVSFGGGSETLGILVHADTVPIGDPGLWTHSPQGELAEGKIYGRGAVDNKGMVISSLYSMAAVKALNLPVFKKVELIIGTREEIVWDDMELYKKEGHPMPDYGFTPDGDFPIINREKGNCEIHIVFNGETCAGELEVLEIKSGDAVNSVPGRAYARLKGNIQVVKDKAADFNKAVSQEKLVIEKISADEVSVTAMGKESHSSLPDHGDNAMTAMCVFLAGLDVGNSAVKEFARFVKDHFNGNFYGDTLGLPSHPQVLNGEEMGRTTVVPSMAYTDDKVHLYLSIRTVYGTARTEIYDTFDRLGSKYNFSYSTLDFLDPLYVPRDHKFIEILANVYEKITDAKAGFILAGGTTYAKALPNSVAFGPVFPDDIDVTHQTDEYISVDKLSKATEIFSMVVAEVLLNKKSLK